MGNSPLLSWIRCNPWRGAAAVIALPLATLTGGCAAYDYRGEDAPTALVSAPLASPTPRVAVVLGSGGPRGYAHIGILKVLEEAGIRPDLVVGSSVGAVIGSFWASGYTASEIDQMSMAGGPLTIFDFSLFADRGWIRGDRLENYLRENLKLQQLQDFPRRMIVVATRKSDQTPRYFTNGNAAVAVRASSAMPGIISPVGIDGVEYEDADVSLPLAVNVARNTGAQFVIAVDVSARPGTTPDYAPAFFHRRDSLRRKRIDPEVSQADFLIHPNLGYWAGPYTSYFVESRRLGEEYARALLPDLLAAMRQKLGPI